MLIAEAGNNHQGSFVIAQDLIVAARESGADLVKMQAFDPETISGSMPRGFYEMCHFTEDDFFKLQEFSEQCGIDLFFSFFSTEFGSLALETRWKKLSAKQSYNLGNDIVYYDHPNSFISVPVGMKIPKIFQATVLHVNDYCIDEDRNLERINELQQSCLTKVGLSDHTIGPQTCLKAIKYYGVETIEKHFCLENQKNNIYYDGQLFRDSVHSSTPKELEAIAKELKK